MAQFIKESIIETVVVVVTQKKIHRNKQTQHFTSRLCLFPWLLPTNAREDAQTATIEAMTFCAVSVCPAGAGLLLLARLLVGLQMSSSFKINGQKRDRPDVCPFTLGCLGKTRTNSQTSA